MSRIPSRAASYIGARIRKLREQRGLTQDQLAVNSDIDSSNVRAYENGRATPSIPTLVRIAEALGVDPGELLAGVTSELFPSNPRDGRRSIA